MKTRQLKENESLQIGDFVIIKTAFGNSKYVVFKISKKYAFVHYNDIAIGKFPIVFDFQFNSLPRQKWSTNTYEVHRPI
jgi:hypothetical protein